MHIDPEDPDLPVNRRERQMLRTVAERVRTRKEKRAELAAARADAEDIAATGPDAYRRRRKRRVYVMQPTGTR